VVGTVRDRAVLWTVPGAVATPIEPPGQPGPAAATPLVAGNSGRCLDVLGADRTPGTALVIYDCHGGVNQQFSYPAAGQAGELRVYGDRCVTAVGGGTADGTRLAIEACDGGAAQRWARTAAGEFRGAASGKCVDVLGVRTENLTEVWLWSCLNAPNQQWDPRAPQTVASAAR
jgi:hypothetical protein